MVITVIRVIRVVRVVRVIRVIRAVDFEVIRVTSNLRPQKSQIPLKCIYS